MPQYPFDVEFERSVPEELAAPYDAWKRRSLDRHEQPW
jgi:hypothetical protein